MEYEFEWDDDKAAANLSKHEVSFDEAKLLFDDPFAITLLDDDAEDEERYITIGSVPEGNVLVVASTLRGATIRIISARRATRPERNAYEKRRFEGQGP